MKKIRSYILNLKKEIYSHKIICFLLFIILALAFLIRVYIIDILLGFYFDQGRDALVIWDLIKNHELFLIGPTTGLAGIFRGPYYYYLIAPFYWLGNGNPVFPSIFLSFTIVLATLVGYVLGKQLQNRVTGIIFAILSSFSFYIVMASRWLSNPTPMFLLSIVLFYSLVQILRSDRLKVEKWWVVVALTLGLSFFNFGSSGELYYFVTVLIFAVWQRKKLPTLKYLLIAGFAFFLTFAPLVLFDLKHEHILSNNIYRTFGQEKSFTLPTKFLFEIRNKAYLNLFPKIIFHSITKPEVNLLLILASSFFFLLPGFLKNEKIKLLLLFLLSPVIGLYFYQGNHTVLYEYYLTGYFLPFLLFVAIILGRLWEFKIGKIVVIIFLYTFLVNNANPLQYILKNKSDGTESITFVNQKQAIDWVYEDAKEIDFNVDVYVPPVIPYSYGYLFTWYGGVIHGREPSNATTKILYTLYEIDSPHPERLNAWLERQKGIGKVISEKKFGGITVQRRERHELLK